MEELGMMFGNFDFGSKYRARLFGTAFLLYAFCLVPCAQAASVFVQIPGINGEQSTPGFPGAMQAQSLEITPDHFVITKNVDSASPSIVQAVAHGTSFPSAFALLYNSTPNGPPDNSLSFQNVLGTSYQIQGGGTTEQDGFAASNPGSLFLELPGIMGETSTPGHPGVMQLESFILSGNQFSIVKPLDSATPAIGLAVVSGTLFTNANALFYNAANPSIAPDGVFAFGNVLATAQQILPGGEVPEERDTFSFATVIPEPATTTLLMCGGLVLVLLFRYRFAITRFNCSTIQPFNG